MNKVAPMIVVAAIAIFYLTGLQSVGAQTVQGTPPPNTPPDIVSITLETSTVYLTCPLGPKQSGEGPDKPPRVMVTVEAKDNENDLLTFTYQVKTGRIVGQGRKVFWDLTGSPIGTHSITAIADDGGGPRGVRLSKEVEVKECSEYGRPASIISIMVDQKTVFSSCPPGGKSISGKCDDRRPINIRTTISQVNVNDSTIEYSVSGGEIVGSGAEVQWLLRGAKPGKYSLKAYLINESVRMAESSPILVTVSECLDCEIFYSCPNISVNVPTREFGANEKIPFAVNLSDYGGPVEYNWTVSEGTIYSGQGTSTIVVQTPNNVKDKEITATVTVNGEFVKYSCRNVASNSVYLSK